METASRTAGRRSSIGWPTGAELLGPATVVVLWAGALALLGFDRADAAHLVWGPFSAQVKVGRTPSPILAAALVGGTAFWVVFVFALLPRWERPHPAVRSAVLSLFTLAWLVTGPMQLALLG